jgi:hypothetical protein
MATHNAELHAALHELLTARWPNDTLTIELLATALASEEALRRSFCKLLQDDADAAESTALSDDESEGTVTPSDQRARKRRTSDNASLRAIIERDPLLQVPAPYVELVRVLVACRAAAHEAGPALAGTVTSALLIVQPMSFARKRGMVRYVLGAQHAGAPVRWHQDGFEGCRISLTWTPEQLKAHRDVSVQHDRAKDPCSSPPPGRRRQLRQARQRRSGAEREGPVPSGFFASCT